MFGPAIAGAMGSPALANDKVIVCKVGAPDMDGMDGKVAFGGTGGMGGVGRGRDKVVVAAGDVEGVGALVAPLGACGGGGLGGGSPYATFMVGGIPPGAGMHGRGVPGRVVVVLPPFGGLGFAAVEIFVFDLTSFDGLGPGRFGRGAAAAPTVGPAAPDPRMTATCVAFALVLGAGTVALLA